MPLFKLTEESWEISGTISHPHHDRHCEHHARLSVSLIVRTELTESLKFIYKVWIKIYLIICFTNFSFI